MLIMKASAIWNKNVQAKQGWAPPEIINPDPNEPDHPPFSFDPRTGELLPIGGHGMDVVIDDLQRRLGRAGIRGADARVLIQHAIDLYNSKHEDDSNHKLPNVDSVQWRKAIFGGPGSYQKEATSEDRLTRAHKPGPDGKRPFIAYHTNDGTAGDDSGRKHIWPESASFPMNDELRTILHEIGMPEVNDIPYVTYNHVPVEMMNEHLVSMREHEMRDMQSGLTSSRLAGQHEQELIHGKIFSDQVAHMLPDAYYSQATGAGRGRRSGAGQSKFERIAAEVMHTMGEAGIAVSEEEAMKLARMPIADLILGRPDLWSATRGGKFGNITKKVASALGFDPESEDYKMHHSHGERGSTDRGKGRHHAGRNILAMAASVGSDELRGHEYEHPGHDFNSEDREMAENIIRLYSESQGRQPIDLGSYDMPTELHPRATRPEGLDEAFDVPDHFHESGRYHPFHTLAPLANTTPAAEPPAAPAPPAPRPAPPLGAPPKPAGLSGDPQRSLFDPMWYGRAPSPPRPSPVRAATPQELAQRQAAHQKLQNWTAPQVSQQLNMPEHLAEMMMAGVQPQQSFFDPRTRQLVRAEDEQVHIDAIRKSIEQMQLKDAMNDPDVMKMIPSGDYSFDSIMDIQTISKSFGITTQDIRALHSSRGDWYRIASEWKVSPQIVKAVKVVFQ